MFSTPHKATLIACIALAVLAGALVASPAAATPAPPNNTTADVPTTTTTDRDDTRNVSIRIDNATWVTDYEYRNGKFRLTLVTSAAVRRVTVSEAIGGDDAGTGYFAIRSVILRSGTPTTVTIPAEMVDGKAIVTLTTRGCIQTGKCPYIQAGSGESTLFDGAATWRIVYTAGFVSMVGVAYGTRRYMKKQAVDDDERRVEEVLD